jgi:alpha-L-rhamnosidase
MQDVSFPSNMLYCGMLQAVAELYCDDTLIMQADSISETIRQMSFDGEFFVDNAIRTEDGKLQITNNRSETCQYYAFFFEVATPDTHPELWHRLTTEFGPHRSKLGLWPEIHPSNAFIGNYLRLDTLVHYGLYEQTMEEMKGYFEHMADTTGTLWEHDDTQASCNHGFASYYAYLLKQIRK